MAERIDRRAFLKGSTSMLLAGSVLGLAACNGDQSAGGQAAGGATGGGGNGGGPVTITFAWWGGTERTRLTNETVDLFEELHPNITVQRQSTDWDPYWERISVQAAGGNLPDIPQMQTRQLAEYAPRGVLLELDDFVDSGAIDVSNVPDVILDSGRIDGKLYMVPTGLAYLTIYYNLDLLEQAGVGAPNPDWSWQDMSDLLLEMRAALPEDVFPSDNLASDFQALFSYLSGNGIEVFDGNELGFTADDVGEWFSFWENLRTQGATLPAELQAQELPGGIENSYIVSGTVAMDVIPANQLATHQDAASFELDMTQFPRGSAGHGQTFANSGMSIAANTANPEASAEWVDFFTNNEEAGIIYRADNGIPSSSAIQEALLDSGVLPPGQVRNFELYQDIVEDVSSVPIYPPSYQAITAALERTYEEVAFGQASVSEGANSFFTEATRLVAG